MNFELAEFLAYLEVPDEWSTSGEHFWFSKVDNQVLKRKINLKTYIENKYFLLLFSFFASPMIQQAFRFSNLLNWK